MFGFEKGLQLFTCIVLERHAVADIGPVKAGDELLRLFQLEAFDDLGSCRRIRRGRQCDAWHIGEAFMQHGQRAIFGAEVVPPLRYAMGFIDGEQADARVFTFVQLLQ